MEQGTGSKLGKEFVKAVYCYPAYLNYMQVHHAKCQAGLQHKLESRLPGERTRYETNINNPRYADDASLTAESEEEMKTLLMKVKEESEKIGLKLSIQKAKMMAFGPITSWQMDGETMETVIDLIFLGSKITADGDCSHEIKRCLLLGRKAMTNLDSVLKSRDITLLTKVHLVKVIVFPVTMYGCESWTIKKAESEELMLSNCGAGEDS